MCAGEVWKTSSDNWESSKHIFLLLLQKACAAAIIVVILLFAWTHSSGPCLSIFSKPTWYRCCKSLTLCLRALCFAPHLESVPLVLLGCLAITLRLVIALKYFKLNETSLCLPFHELRSEKYLILADLKFVCDVLNSHKEDHWEIMVFYSGNTVLV